MRTAPASDVLRRQLLVVRNEAVWVRRGLEGGHQPPRGFDDSIISAFAAIGSLDLQEAERCRSYAKQIQVRKAEGWDIDVIDRVIDRIDGAVRELAGSRHAVKNSMDG
ncbi:MAG TPA: hypothetical protein VK745_33090 [Polyangiaceae bacterium]|nr:hypothetical protein [Polyangiaceae bacterium]